MNIAFSALDFRGVYYWNSAICKELDWFCCMDVIASGWMAFIARHGVLGVD